MRRSRHHHVGTCCAAGGGVPELDERGARRHARRGTCDPPLPNRTARAAHRRAGPRGTSPGGAHSPSRPHVSGKRRRTTGSCVTPPSTTSSGRPRRSPLSAGTDIANPVRDRRVVGAGCPVFGRHVSSALVPPKRGLQPREPAQAFLRISFVRHFLESESQRVSHAAVAAGSQEAPAFNLAAHFLVAESQ